MLFNYRADDAVFSIKIFLHPHVSIRKEPVKHVFNGIPLSPADFKHHQCLICDDRWNFLHETLIKLQSVSTVR
ncbi:Uncharacterised protein [Bacillus licheniformis]|nr:Uncharacterised protein [Bacillus licheniformis]